MTELKETQLGIQALIYLNGMDGIIQSVEEAEITWKKLSETYRQKIMFKYFEYRK